MLLFLGDIREFHKVEVDLFWQCFDLVRKERQEKVRKMKAGKNRERSVMAGLLLNYATKHYVLQGAHAVPMIDDDAERKWMPQDCINQCTLNIVPIEEMMASYDAQYDYPLTIESNGKPVFDFTGIDGTYKEEIHFNLSHSGDYVVCAIGNGPVGVDIEGSRALSLRTAKRFFTEAEYQWVSNGVEESMSAEVEQRFLRVWTLKEAYSKYTGVGIAYGIRQAEFLPVSAEDETEQLSLVKAGEGLDCEKLQVMELAIEAYRIGVVFSKIR